MEFFDTHCHLDFPEFDHDRDEVIAQCDQLGVKHILIPGVTAEKWPRVVRTAEMKDTFYSALGLHPMFLDRHEEAHLDQLEVFLNKESSVAVGEIGLDFYVDGLDRKKQFMFFDAQLEIAKRHSLPVILHVRKAHDEVLKLLRQKKLVGGFVHAFSGSEQQAFQYIDLNFKLGFGGAVSYQRANKLRTILKNLSLTDFVLETDAPDMSPSTYKGGRNSPQYIPEIFELIVELRSGSKKTSRGDAGAVSTGELEEESSVDLATQIFENSLHTLGLKSS